MLLSFSQPEMLPYLIKGVDEARGIDVGDARVKRQTIRPRTVRYRRLLDETPYANWTHWIDLHLWFKSRTPARQRIGTVQLKRIYPITIQRGTVEPPDGDPYPICRIDGPTGWRIGDPMLSWTPGEFEPAGFAGEAYKDGFDSLAAFCDFFALKVGDRFEGVLLKW